MAIRGAAERLEGRHSGAGRVGPAILLPAFLALQLNSRKDEWSALSQEPIGARP